MTYASRVAATFWPMGHSVHTHRVDRVVSIRIDRPPVNSLGPNDWVALREAIESANDQEDVRAVVIEGGVGRFCAGADIRTLIEPSAEPTLMLRLVSEACEGVRSSRFPYVAAIDGAAHGGGLELALACDIRIASPGSTFAASGVNMGLIANVRSLVQVAGDARARSMLLTGRRIDAMTAESWGLVTEVDSDAREVAHALAALIATKAPRAVQATKEALQAVSELRADDHAALVTSLFSTLAQTNDHHEAINSFLEKRPPLFRGD